LVFNQIKNIPPSDWLIIEQISDQIENFSKPMIESLYEENFAQGRLERTLNLPVTPVMDEETVRKTFVISQIRTYYL